MTVYSLMNKKDHSWHYRLLGGGHLLAHFTLSYYKSINEWSNSRLIEENILEFQFLLDIVQNYEIDRFNTQGRYTCPLCRVYIDGGCDGCPISKFTKKPYCQDTPYESYEDYDDFDETALDDGEFDYEEFLKNEINFLKSLPEYDGTLAYDPNDYYILVDEE